MAIFNILNFLKMTSVLAIPQTVLCIKTNNEDLYEILKLFYLDTET